MAIRNLARFVERLRNVVPKQEGAGIDADLLHRFVQQKDETAFEALVRKHGPMVMGVCRRILRNSHDAEDAFQSTFLVLARKASTIRRAGMVGNWLYGVASRTAQEARKSAAKRRVKESNVVLQTETPKDAWDDLQPILDQELERLPGKYRVVVLLCYLEGKTRKAVAEQLGWPEGTVAGRLATARSMLTKRLARHGTVLSGGVLGGLLTQNASACVSPSVVSATVKAGMLFAAGQTGVLTVEVAALTKEILRTMFLTKLKRTASVLLMLGLFAVSCGVGAQQQSDEKTDKAPQAKANEPNVEQVVKEKQAEPSIKELRERRLALLVEIHDGTVKRLMADPTALVDEVYKTMADITNARLDLAQTKEDRIKVLQEAVKKAEEWEKTVVELHEKGLMSNLGSLKAQAFSLETRIILEKAKAPTKSD